MSKENNTKFDINNFYNYFGKGDSNEKIIFVKSPARVNIIGEHTDYNGGYVLPCALSFGTVAFARKRLDNKIKLKSLSFEGIEELDLKDINVKRDNWTDYVLGVLNELVKDEYNFGGFEICINSDIPLGSGLSSSASLEVLICETVNNLYNLNINTKEMALISQRAENNFLGVKCGIMDQFIIANGEDKKAMLLKCSTLDFQSYDLNLKDYKIVICNTKKSRKLVESKYNERLGECKKALEVLQNYITVENLADVTVEDFEKYKNKIEDETVRNRAKHVIYETKRTLDSTKALLEGDIIKLGQLMIQSHNSLKEDYEVTGLELDTIVSEVLKIDGVIGARMTGAGFGGCAVALVHKDSINTLTETVFNSYFEKIGTEPEFYIATVSKGVHSIDKKD